MRKVEVVTLRDDVMIRNWETRKFPIRLEVSGNGRMTIEEAREIAALLSAAADHAEKVLSATAEGAAK